MSGIPGEGISAGDPNGGEVQDAVSGLALLSSSTELRLNVLVHTDFSKEEEKQRLEIIKPVKCGGSNN